MDKTVTYKETGILVISIALYVSLIQSMIEEIDFTTLI